VPSARERWCRGCRSIHFSHDVAPVAARASTGIDAKLFVDCVNVVNNELSHLHLCRDCLTKQVHPSSRWCFGPFFGLRILEFQLVEVIVSVAMRKIFPFVAISTVRVLD
jgi:hypothetical protein